MLVTVTYISILIKMYRVKGTKLFDEARQKRFSSNYVLLLIFNCYDIGLFFVKRFSFFYPKFRVTFGISDDSSAFVLIDRMNPLDLNIIEAVVSSKMVQWFFFCLNIFQILLCFRDLKNVHTIYLATKKSG